MIFNAILTFVLRLIFIMYFLILNSKLRALSDEVQQLKTGHSDISKIELSNGSEKIFEIVKSETEKYNKSAHKNIDVE